MIRNTKQIAINTLFLYFRSIVVMLIGVYTSRVVLQALGVDDYGIYNVIGGFVAMFSVLSSSLVHASQRFISYEMGKESPQMRRLFCGTVSIHLLFTLGIFVLFETIGIWFLNTQLNISADRIVAANWVFQCSVLTFCINLICIPYNATIIAHEKMSVFAYISIYEAIAKLGIVLLLTVMGFDKLIDYAVLMLLIAVSLRLIYGIYCSRHFEECKFHFVYDKPLFKEILSLSGWNFIGSTAVILSTHGINILTNIFFGVTLNAARGLAGQVNQAVNSFVTNFMTAMNPQITKSCSAGDFDYMNKLMARGAKYAALLYWFIVLTVFVETEIILDIWLIEVPPFLPLFLRLTIIYSIFQALSHTLYIGMLASGDIKRYQIVMGSIYIGCFVLCYVLFRLGLGPEFGYISTILAVFIVLFVRLQLLKGMIPAFSPQYFIKESVIKSFCVIILSTGIVFLLKYIIAIENKYFELLVILLLSVTVVVVIAWALAFHCHERTMILNQVKKRYKHKFER
ncbi:MAG: lipopolysaccharide biosynthesis protein [Prevotella sp.]|nr:lipopolysaccharide biosynthesis protein [Prevotella sp.]